MPLGARIAPEDRPQEPSGAPGGNRVEGARLARALRLEEPARLGGHAQELGGVAEDERKPEAGRDLHACHAEPAAEVAGPGLRQENGRDGGDEKGVAEDANWLRTIRPVCGPVQADHSASHMDRTARVRLPRTPPAVI